MAIVCWGNLTKAADDNTKIEEAIVDYIAGHDENPNAHMGPDYALGAHRLQVELDHLPYSILNKYLYPQSRTYNAVVDATGNGDVSTIQAGLDYAHSLGGGVVFVKRGTYTLTSDLILYDNVELIGEDMTDTIIDFNSAAYEVRFVIVHDAKVENFTIKNSISYGIYVNSAASCRFKNLSFDNNEYDLYIEGTSRQNVFEDIHSDDAAEASFLINITASDINTNIYRNIIIEDPVGSGVTHVSGYKQFFRDVLVERAQNAGFCLNGSALDYSNFINCQARNGDSIGFYLDQADRVTFVACRSSDNADSGFQFDNVDNCSFSGCFVNDNTGWGFDIASGCDDNIIVANQIIFNSSGAVTDAGSGNIVEHNQT